MECSEGGAGNGPACSLTTTQGWMRHLRVLGDINHLPPEPEWNRGKRKIVLGVQNNLSITTMTLATLMTGSRRIL